MCKIWVKFKKQNGREDPGRLKQTYQNISVTLFLSFTASRFIFLTTEGYAAAIAAVAAAMPSAMPAAKPMSFIRLPPLYVLKTVFADKRLPIRRNFKRDMDFGQKKRYNGIK